MSFKLFNYPPQAVFGKVLPKSKIYEFAKPSNRVRELFIKQVEQIVWEYKLSPDTINIPPGEGVQEIQIFKIQSKVPEINEEVFRTIDEAIPSHIFYEVSVGNKLKLVASYKRQNEADSTKWVTGAYFSSEWVPHTTERNNIPLSLNMGGLYAQLLRDLMPLPAQAGEGIRAQAERLMLLIARKSELEKLKIKLAKEKQFNRKVDINAQIKRVEENIKKLVLPPGE